MEYHCFIAWNQKISTVSHSSLINAYGRENIAVAKTHWGKADTKRYLRKLYGLRMTTFEEKSKLLDDNGVLFFICKDENPIYAMRKTTTGYRKVYAKGHDIKTEIRKQLSIQFVLHASDNLPEASRNIYMLTNESPGDAFCAIKEINLRQKIPLLPSSDLLKSQWKTIEDLERGLYFSSGCFAVDTITASSVPTKHSTFICPDIEDTCHILNENKHPLSFRDGVAYTSAMINDDLYPIRLIDIGLSYFCPRLLEDLINMSGSGSLDFRRLSLEAKKILVAYSTLFIPKPWT